METGHIQSEMAGLKKIPSHGAFGFKLNVAPTQRHPKRFKRFYIPTNPKDPDPSLSKRIFRVPIPSIGCIGMDRGNPFPIGHTWILRVKTLINGGAITPLISG